MPLKKVNPNRMELMKLKKRLRLAVRGHKLMKDKFDELLKEFYSLAKEVVLKRKDIEKKLLIAYEKWAEGRAFYETGLTEAVALKAPRKLHVEKKIERRMGAEKVTFIPHLKEEKNMILPFEWNFQVRQTFAISAELVKELVELAGLEQTLKNLAEEMEKTRRRVNALEQILIPQLETQIKEVQAKLDELDRETRTRVAKVKEMIKSK